MATADKSVIVLKLATNREDGGKTENYRVYGGGGVVQMKNRKGEAVSKNALLGGNGTVYIANELAGDADAYVLIPKSEYDRLTHNSKQTVKTATKK